MLLRAFWICLICHLIPYTDVMGLGSDFPDGHERKAEQGSFLARLNENENFVPARVSDLALPDQKKYPRELLVMLRDVELQLFDAPTRPDEAAWQALEKGLITLPQIHLFHWYHLYYKSVAYAEVGDYKNAKVLGERSLSQALALRSNMSLLASFGLLSVLAKGSGDFEEALRYVELFNKHEKKVKADAKLLVVPDSAAPEVVKRSNSKAFYFWVVLGLVVMLGLGWYWLPYKLVWLPVGMSRQQAAFEGEVPVWASNTRQQEEEIALTDEEIVVDEAKVELLAILRTHKLITNDDWLAFQQLFTRIHPDFLIHLRFKHKGITPAEEKLACMIRVHFTTREIARLLAVSVNSVNISRYRLRKRCKLNADITLEEYLMRF